MPKPLKTIEKQMFFNDFWRQEGQESMPSWFLGGLVVVLKTILHVSGAMLWSTGLPRANMIPSWAHLGPILGPSWPYLGASWGQGGAKMGFLGRLLGCVAAFWAPLGPSGGILGPPGKLRQGILRQRQGLEALA